VSFFVGECRGESRFVWWNGGAAVPLTESVSFKTVLQKGNRIQLPKLVRWKYKLEQNQILKVSVTALNFYGGWETFLATMDKSGRITVPKLVLRLLEEEAGEESLAGAVMEVNIEPA
jgi:bifunctional DNA-binding transcriptional regulator/antitoxin component of YhaV-PrlF toxin-antitoxin module